MGVIHFLFCFAPWLIKTCVIDLHIVILNLQAFPLCIICSEIKFRQIDDEIILYIMICKKGRSF